MTNKNIIKTQIITIYGDIAKDIHTIYNAVNPLNQNVDYWIHVGKFLEHLHNVLYKDDYQYSLNNILSDHYFFIAQICTINSFDVFERIAILNDKDRKSCKNIANRISHELMYNYLEYLKNKITKQTTTSHDFVPIAHPKHPTLQPQQYQYNYPPQGYFHTQGIMPPPSRWGWYWGFNPWQQILPPQPPQPPQPQPAPQIPLLLPLFQPVQPPQPAVPFANIVQAPTTTFE